MPAELWRNVTLSAAGIGVPCMVSSPTMQLNPRKIVLANGTASGNALFGYAKGRAKAGFKLKTMLFSGNANAFCNAILNTAGVEIAMQYGAVGGVAVANCLLTDLGIDWSEGGDPELTATFDTKTKPTVGATVGEAAGYGDPFFGEDVTEVTLPGGDHVKLFRVAFKLTRTLAQDFGNSHDGLPQDQGVSTTECTLEAEYSKENDAEASAFLGGTGDCPTVAECGLIFTQVCPTNGTPATFAVNLTDAFHEQLPEVGAKDVEGYIHETAIVRARKGVFAIA